jgi:hypothetical protein
LPASFSRDEVRWSEIDAFDPMAFERELAATSNPLISFRTLLKQSDARLKALFQDGTPAHELVPAGSSGRTRSISPWWRWAATAGANCIPDRTWTSWSCWATKRSTPAVPAWRVF